MIHAGQNGKPATLASHIAAHLPAALQAGSHETDELTDVPRIVRCHTGHLRQWGASRSGGFQTALEYGRAG
jgi:hypothetical protein